MPQESNSTRSAEILCLAQASRQRAREARKAAGFSRQAASLSQSRTLLNPSISIQPSSRSATAGSKCCHMVVAFEASEVKKFTPRRRLQRDASAARTPTERQQMATRAGL